MAFRTEQPEYIDLRDMLTQHVRPVVFWCGAGLSQPAGLPSWKSLRTALESDLKSKIDSLRESSTAHAARIGKYHDIRLKKDPWVAFEMLEHELGAMTYRASIARPFAAVAGARAPEIYRKLWMFKNVRGLINLNLDRLATQGYNQQFERIAPVEFNGINLNEHANVLGLSPRFICNLHGVIDNTRSWVFTHTDLGNLKSIEGYDFFIKSVLGTCAVVFVGMTVDDPAVAGHLESFRSKGLALGSHYWITSRDDPVTDSWANQRGIQVIRYSSYNGNHGELHELFSDLLRWIPQEPSDHDPVQPTMELPNAAPLPPPMELAGRSPEEIRFALNAHAKRLLIQDTDESRQAYSDFLRDYAIPVHMACFTDTAPGRNELLGYRLKREIGGGGFGTVYEGEDPKRNPVAIKVVGERARRNTEMLMSFRRGVKSMQILSDHGVQGMVEYREASEIPPFVVMDLIHGLNLEQLLLNRGEFPANPFVDAASVLSVSKRLAGVIERAHRLPARVLHRDLRPANIMMKGIWESEFVEDWELVVLDFDLSWHRGALDQTAMQPMGTIGYLAPEQLTRVADVSTRHAAVDSFGMGMVMYFLVSAQHPRAGQHLERSWKSSIETATRMRSSRNWRSASRRLARVILNATQNAQSDRWDMFQILSELERLSEADKSSDHVQSSELIAEELAERCSSMREYVWDEDQYTAKSVLATGASVNIQGNEQLRVIEVSMSYVPSGHERWGHNNRHVTASEAMTALFRKNGWEVKVPRGSQSGVSVIATRSSEQVLGELDAASGVIEQAVSHLTGLTKP